MKPLDYYWYTSNRITWLLLPLSFVFMMIAAVRKKLYQYKLKKSFSFDVPVVVIGNIVAGGSGKTPLLISICEYLQNKGFKPGIVSRGYGGSCTVTKQVEISDSANFVGDEPMMVFQRTKAPVVIGVDRADAVKHLLKNNDCDIVLSDDGLQHYRMQRDLEIVVVDSERLFGNGLCMPAGPLREPVSRLKTVDLVVYNGTHLTADEDCSYTLQFTGVKSLNSAKTVKLSTFMDREDIHAVAGIGNPGRFFEQLNRNGINIEKHAFPDHYSYGQNDFVGWDNACIIMTEKDAIKCHQLELPDAWVLGVEADMSVVLEKRLNELLLPLLNA